MQSNIKTMVNTAYSLSCQNSQFCYATRSSHCKIWNFDVRIRFCYVFAGLCWYFEQFFFRLFFLPHPPPPHRKSKNHTTKWKNNCLSNSKLVSIICATLVLVCAINFVSLPSPSNFLNERNLCNINITYSIE